MAKNNTTSEGRKHTTQHRRGETRGLKRRRKPFIFDPIYQNLRGHLRIEAIIDENIEL